jgi:predicted AlkP superfamily pyrophosphatase or phosphodiesterase
MSPNSHRTRGLVLSGGLLSLCALLGPPPDARPTLVVLVAVDQLRADLISVYQPLFTGGLARLFREGRHYPNARVAHAPTNSMPGHVTLATGMHPRHHGIVDNGFFETLRDGTRRYTGAVSDTAGRIVGVPDQAGVSMRRLEVDGLADWILARDTAAVAVAVSMNEYGALLHAGRGTDRRSVYWFSPDAARFVTSAAYASTDPPWVTRFNESLSRRYFPDSTWRSRVPPNSRSFALPDSGSFENGGAHVAFPHRFAVERDSVWKPTFGHWLYFTPYPDRAAVGLAIEAVVALRRGQRGATDYLSLTLGSSDGIGHWFGPRSQEQLDNLLRLDHELGLLLAALDQAVGRGRYLLALSADHGAPDIPEAPPAPRRMEFGPTTGTRISDAEVDRLFQQLAAAAPGTLPADSARQIATGILRRTRFVADVIGAAALADSLRPPADSFAALYRNSYRPDRTPVRPLAGRYGTLARFGLIARLVPGAVVGDVPSEHGSAYDYDRRVAMLFFGPGIPSGTDLASARTVDVAPTLAALAGFAPNQITDGRPLLAGLRPSRKP